MLNLIVKKCWRFIFVFMQLLLHSQTPKNAVYLSIQNKRQLLLTEIVDVQL